MVKYAVEFSGKCQEKGMLPSHGVIQSVKEKYTCWSLTKAGIVMLKNN